MTLVVEFPPGDPGTSPHRHPGPAFGLVLEGEMVFELEGEPARVVRAGEAFWEPGGDVIQYQDGNNRDDIPVRFTVTMLCEPGRQMLVLVDDDELAQRQDRRAPRALTPYQTTRKAAPTLAAAVAIVTAAYIISIGMAVPRQIVSDDARAASRDTSWMAVTNAPVPPAAGCARRRGSDGAGAGR